MAFHKGRYHLFRCRTTSLDKEFRAPLHPLADRSGARHHRDNPLAKSGHFSSAGRQWATSCNDEWTGASACRSFILTGGRWVFNNLVYFTPGTAQNPRTHFDRATGRLTIDGVTTNPPESLNRGGSTGLDQTNARTRAVTAHIWDNWPQIRTMHGWRQGTTPDHPAGRAVDVMIPGWRTPDGNALGWQIAEYYRTHAARFGINYIIFDAQIWSVARDRDGWRLMEDRGSDSANHYDHVHINTYG